MGSAEPIPHAAALRGAPRRESRGAPVPLASVDLLLFLTFLCAGLALVRLLGLASLGGYLQPQWQFLDFPELSRHPFASLLTQHSQPPMLNLIAAAILALGIDLYDGFIVVNSVAAAFTCLVVYKVTLAYTESSWGAGLVATAYLVSPASLLNIAYPFYPCLTAAAFAALIYSFHAALTQPRRALILNIAAIVFLSLLRSSFTLAHAALFAGAFAYLNRRALTARWLASAMVVCAVGAAAIPLKNQAMYGFFGASSWTPLNLASGFGIKTGTAPFLPPNEIRQKFPSMQCSHSHGAQDLKDFKSSGYPNYNSCIVIEYARMQGEMIVRLYEPAAHWKKVSNAMQLYFSPPDAYPYLTNRQAIAGYAQAFNALFGTAPLPRLYLKERLLVLATLAVAAIMLVRWRDRFLAVALATIVIHFLTHVLTDGEESNRFVFDVEFLFFTLFGIGVAALFRALISRPAAA